MQIVKWDLLSHSKDPTVLQLCKLREQRNASLSRVWKATNAISEAKAQVELEIKFPSQSTRQGLGFGKFNPNPSAAQKRKMITSKALSISDESLLTHTHSLKRQSVWLKWA